ncbi:hypothetical protein [Brevibacillus brevis]|uniref:hypothetical protein n=1 Tax=Brevibacillus brevis TaxID=1393 RepID=UPI001143DFAF|nr:hypothetical protein [Brevibacillus brevis]
MESASTEAARHGAQWTRWRFIEGFGGYLPAAVSLPQSAGTKHQGDLMDKTLRVIRIFAIAEIDETK